MTNAAERADARANRARLIEAAHAVFRERGLDAEMKEIAERAGVGIGTIYRNFPRKDDLIAAIIGEAIDAMVASTEAAEQEPDVVEALRVFLRRGFAVAERYGDVLMAMMAGHLPEACKDEFKRLNGFGRVTAIVQRGIDSGVFRADIDPEIAAVRLIASFEPWHYHHLRRTRTMEQLLDAHTVLTLRGMLAQEPA